jgi:tRNA(fMet)-specific endonuclease VapC
VLIDDDDEVAIAAVTVAELRVGVLLAKGRARLARAAYVDEVVEVVPLIPYDGSVAEAHALLLTEVRRQGRPRGAHDLIIAATAVATGRTVVTADARAFADLPGVEVRGY